MRLAILTPSLRFDRSLDTDAKGFPLSVDLLFSSRAAYQPSRIERGPIGELLPGSDNDEI